jgi:hypothetical protein
MQRYKICQIHATRHQLTPLLHASLRLHVYLAEELRAQKTVRDAFASAYDRVDIDARDQVSPLLEYFFS